MLGNCLVRYPTTGDKKLDMGALCEALLFFSATHLVLDQGTLSLVIQAQFLDDLIEMLERGYLTASFEPATPALYTDNKGGLKEHFYTMISIQSSPGFGSTKRGPDALLMHLERGLNDKQKARTYHRRLCKFLSFKTTDRGSLIKKAAAADLIDPSFACQIASMSLQNFGVPLEEIKFSRLRVFPLGDDRFTVESDIDFEHLKKFVPSEPNFGIEQLLPGVGDARLDISMAAQHNAAFIGNNANQRIVEMILEKAIGAGMSKDEVPRAIYDFISVDTPSIREVINSGARTPREFIALLGSASEFRKWIAVQNPNSDLIQEMLKEKTKTGWLEKVPVKAARFGVFTGAGFVADLFAPGSSAVLSAADAFLVDRLLKKWRPHFFVENKLRGFLDASSH